MPWSVLADVAAVDEDAAGRRIVEARNQADDGRLPAARGAHHAHELTRRDRKSDILQNGDLRIVRKRYVLELDRANESIRLAGIRPFLNAHVDIEDGLDPFEPDVCLRDGIRHLRQILDGLEESGEIREKHGQGTDGHRAGEGESRSSPEDDRRAQRDDDGDDRRKQRLHAPRAQRGLRRGALASRRAVPPRRPARQRRRTVRIDSESGLNDGNNVALTPPHFGCRPLHGSPEPGNEEQQKWCDAHDEQREVPIEPEHQTQHPHDRHEIDNDAQRRRRHEILYRGDVVGNRAEELSGLMRVVVLEREPLEVVVHPQAGRWPPIGRRSRCSSCRRTTRGRRRRLSAPWPGPQSRPAICHRPRAWSRGG